MTVANNGTISTYSRLDGKSICTDCFCDQQYVACGFNYNATTTYENPLSCNYYFNKEWEKL